MSGCASVHFNAFGLHQHQHLTWLYSAGYIVLSGFRKVHLYHTLHNIASHITDVGMRSAVIMWERGEMAQEGCRSVVIIVPIGG
jgi:hypothetical protein